MRKENNLNQNLTKHELILERYKAELFIERFRKNNEISVLNFMIFFNIYS
jgi:hypothetical protein